MIKIVVQILLQMFFLSGFCSPIAQVTIYRDEYGVPHIYGKSDADVIFGFAYAQAQDNFWQIESSYLGATGRSSEVNGEKKFNQDLLCHTLEIPGLSKKEYQESTPYMKSLLDAFANGLNYFLLKNPSVKPRLFKHFEPWYPIALIRFKYYQDEFFFKARIPFSDISYKDKSKEESPFGSNAWAINSAKSKNGSAMLFINPHVAFLGLNQYTEVHLHSEEGINFSGLSRFGFLLPYMGHNEKLGWSYTDNNPDIVDVYQEAFDNPHDSLIYKYGNSYKKAMQWTDSIKIKNKKGYESRKIVLLKTHHGPIIKSVGKIKYAIRMSKMEEGRWYDQWIDMIKSNDFVQFKKAISKIHVPYMNLIYADQDNNIFYLYNAAIPKRNKNFDWKTPLDGSNPSTEWNGYHNLDELPQVLNPTSGFVQNCNSSPFFTSLSDNPDSRNYPDYFFDDEILTTRAKMSLKILSEKEKFSFNEWSLAAFDTYIIEAERILPELQKEYLKIPPDAGLKEAIDTLLQWNKVSTTSSIAMSLFMYSFATPDSVYNSRVEQLKKGIYKLEKNWNTWKVQWGTINRLQRKQQGDDMIFDDKKQSLPVAGASGSVGIIFNFYTKQEKGSKLQYGTSGHSYVSVVEFGHPVKAKSILTFGQNSNPFSLHYFDQAYLYAKGEMKPAWFSLEQIKQHSFTKPLIISIPAY